jgi:hypothetical protein
MTDCISLHDEYALVPSRTFVDRLTHEWTTSYHNVPSVPLRQLWTTMAETYRDAICLRSQNSRSWRDFRLCELCHALI